MKPDDFLLDAWKQQVDIGFRVLETLIEGATKLHEAQLEAACDAHADLVATRKTIAAATSAPELLKLQAQWAGANMESCMAYWRQMYEAMSDTNADLVNCMQRKAA
ncbi:MAG TPA: TIGR01841 family phasin [Burkholderiales bacterium]|jgi:phasin family protein|nr:TIGR01841 family phasin [Burkholderiales bacterium]